MSEISLNWKNKDLAVMASGNEEYVWVNPTDSRTGLAARIAALSGKLPNRESNALVVGDGFDVVKALAEQTDFFDEKIRLIYIDPPYNTNADVACYNDALDRSMWLGMLRDRLSALKPHLADDASIWLHLDDCEVHRARFVLDEVFGEEAFVSSVIWQKRTTRESRAAFSTNHETILVYALAGAKAWKVSRNLLPKDASELRNRDNDPRGPWTDAPFTAPGIRPAQQYPIRTPSGRVLTPPRGRSWYATESTFKKLLVENRIWFPKGGEGSPRLKLFNDKHRGLVPSTIWGSSETGTNDDAKRHLLALFAASTVFDTPKPEVLLERIIHVASNEGDLVVDIFAGSGTTGAVAQKMGRRWLMVERSLPTVERFTLPRLECVVGGRDDGGITRAHNWRGGGAFEVAYVPPSFGSGFSTLDLNGLKRQVRSKLVNKKVA